jgi:small neutral amino acid transporter SnatA (MarC family)
MSSELLKFAAALFAIINPFGKVAIEMMVGGLAELFPQLHEAD